MDHDKELLELAAKAAGIPTHELRDTIGDGGGIESYGWNPLTDDGDSMRLAVKLSMRVYVYAGGGDDSTVVASDELGTEAICREAHNGDPLAATRRAITRAAAEIGRAMP